MLTAWDGFCRVDYLPEFRRLQVTVTTLEPTVYQEVRPGLAVTFVADDPDGPPTFLSIDLGAELGGELPLLLGRHLTDVATQVITSAPHSAGLQLDLDELAALADTWAPYRAEVLAAANASAEPAGSSVGTWARDLWTRLGGPELVGAIAAVLSAPRPAYGDRGPAEDDSETRDQGTPARVVPKWRSYDLPPALAREAGVEPRISWLVASEISMTGVALRITATGDPAARNIELLAGFDDGSEHWVPFVPRRDSVSILQAQLECRPGHEHTRIRLRTRRTGDG